jgi:outer membrane lipoprotein SlyB
MKKFKLVIIPLAAIASLLLGGCQTPNTTATLDQLQKSYTCENGIVREVKEIIIDETSGEHDGAFMGALVGGIEGAEEDGIEGALVGAVAGAVIGEFVENVFGTIKAYELIIERESGAKLVVLQRRQSIQGIQPNERVIIYMDIEGNTLVRRA